MSVLDPSSGSESILMSMKAHRDWARDTKGIDKPNVVLANTAHPAFDKAARYERTLATGYLISNLLFTFNCALFIPTNLMILSEDLYR